MASYHSEHRSDASGRPTDIPRDSDQLPEEMLFDVLRSLGVVASQYELVGISYD